MVTRKNRPRHAWTTEQEADFAAKYPTANTADLARELGLRPSQLHDKALALGIKKDPEWIKGHLLECARKAQQSPNWRGWEPGHATWNKGLKFASGGRSVATRFQPGSIPANFLPIGSERVVDGFRQRKMTATGYPPRDWVPLHHVLWEQAGRGSIPTEMVLTFRDGDKTNLAIENLELISRAELMRRNSIHNYGPEIARLGQLKGALLRQIRRKSKNEE